MRTIPYSSDPQSNFPTLSEKSWQEFSKYISRYQWALDEPCNSPRKTEIAHAILNKGKPGACTSLRKEGYKMILRPMHLWGFEQAVTQQRKLYYVSSGTTALLYFDIDLHNAWQTEEVGQEAKRLIEALFHDCFGKSVIFWSDSKRGMNGYLKVNRQGMPPGFANTLFARLEHALRRFLAYRKNLADFEIKGRFGFMENDQYHWSQFGKLPVHSPDWNFPKLQEFTEKSTVVLARLRVLCEQIEKQIPQDVLDRHNLQKKALGDAPITKKGYFLVSVAMKKALEAKYGEDWRWEFGDQYGDNDNPWFSLKYYRPEQLPMTAQEWRESQKQNTQVQVEEFVPLVEPVPLVRSIPKKAPITLNLDFADLMNEPDSFMRQKEALFRYSRYLKRVPTLDEALALLREHHLFSGTWDEHEDRRRIRVTSILDFIAKTFDASKMAKGSVNLGKYDEWAKKKFPNGLTGRRKRYLNEDGKIVEGRHRSCVGPKFISVFMSIAEFGLLTDKNSDESLPHKRAEMVWNALFQKELISVKFCARKWAVCREAMVKSEIIVIIDRNYGPQKAMKWDEGRYFPGLGLWKCKRQPSLLEPGCYSTRTRREEREEEHNTLLYKQPARFRDFGSGQFSRPPPVEKQAASSKLTRQNDIPEARWRGKCALIPPRTPSTSTLTAPDRPIGDPCRPQ